MSVDNDESIAGLTYFGALSTYQSRCPYLRPYLQAKKSRIFFCLYPQL